MRPAGRVFETPGLHPKKREVCEPSWFKDHPRNVLAINGLELYSTCTRSIFPTFAISIYIHERTRAEHAESRGIDLVTCCDTKRRANSV